MPKRHDYSKGFTLTELMVTLSVLGILAALALPGMGELLKNNRLASQTNDITTVLAYARAEAMRRGARMTLCPSANGADCTGGSDWSVGFIVFADSNRDATVSPGEEVLRTIEPLSGNNALTVSGIGSSLQFRGSGVVTSPGSYKICDDRPDKGRRISIASSGSISLTKDVACP